MKLSEPAVQPASRPASPDSYRRLADVFHLVLSEHSLDALLERIADTLADLVPYDSLTIYKADEAKGVLTPVLARDPWADQILSTEAYFGEGFTGWAAENQVPLLTNDTQHDPRGVQIPGTPDEPEALIAVPLISNGTTKGVLNVYRLGEGAEFSDEDFALAQRFGDAAALGLDNAESRATLEQLAHTDSLTGLYNHRFFQDRLRAELTRASRADDKVSLLLIDLDDFKQINDVYGHGTGDQILTTIADMARSMVRASDVACRIGGEEIALIMPSSDGGDALGFARRFLDALSATNFSPVGKVTVSIGVAQGPQHAMNPRELMACAEAAMMTVKARGKDGVLLYEVDRMERPDGVHRSHSDVRSIAHLKMLQSLSAKLNRLNEVKQIGNAIANELRTLIDYHVCRVFVADGDFLVPIAVRGDLPDHDEAMRALSSRFGEGITGVAAETRRSLLIPNALECDYAVTIPGTEDIAESIVAVPMSYGPRTLGVIVMSQLGVDQFDEDDVRLLEVLAGHASVALENARLYESQRREAESAKALLECADVMARSPSPHAIANETVAAAARLLETPQASMWTRHEASGEFVCSAHAGYIGDHEVEGVPRARISPSEATALLDGKKLPFVVAAGADLPLDSWSQAKDYAFAPLHGLEGWIVVRAPAAGVPYFNEQRLRLLAGISYQTSVAMQKADLFKRQKESAEIANSLLEFARVLASTEGMEDTLERIVEQAALILGSPRTSLWLQDVSSGEIRAAAAHGNDAARRDRILAARFDAATAKPFADLKEVFVIGSEQAKEIEGVIDIGDPATCAVAPLKIEGGRLGFIAVAAPALGAYEFSERKMKLLSGIAHQAALAINSSLSFETLEKTFLDTVEALANALEARDEYTSSHARWITDTSIEVGKLIGLDVATIKRLELAALFHDIGKIGVPNEILQKPGPLTDEEWVIMKQHPQMGADILAPIERLADVRPIVRACHEHYDGSGYPDGKAGDEIPVEARIILVVDAFHAMTTDRPYRDGLPCEEAFRRLRESSGAQFDPAVVDALLWLFEQRPELAESA